MGTSIDSITIEDTEEEKILNDFITWLKKHYSNRDGVCFLFSIIFFFIILTDYP